MGYETNLVQCKSSQTVTNACPVWDEFVALNILAQMPFTFCSLRCEAIKASPALNLPLPAELDKQDWEYSVILSKLKSY